MVRRDDTVIGEDASGSRRAVRFLAAALASVVVVAGGCTAPLTGHPLAAPAARPPGTGSAPGPASGPTFPDGYVGQAPRVVAPLHDQRVIDDPCSALSARQLAGLGMTPAVHTDVTRLPVGNVCNWDDDTVGTVGASLGVGVQIILIHGLSDIYAQRSDMAYFIPVTIEGYPAVLADLTDQRSSVGTCALNLGVADTSVLSLDYQQEDLPGTLACAKVQALARDVVDTLRTP